MAKTRVFISYDYEHDSNLKDTFIAQAKLPDSPFSIHDVSIQQPIPNWQQKARSSIESCDVFVVLLGDYTYQAQGVLREIKMARVLKKRRFQLRKKGQQPRFIDGAGEIVVWKWKNLQKRLGK